MMKVSISKKFISLASVLLVTLSLYLLLAITLDSPYNGALAAGAMPTSREAVEALSDYRPVDTPSTEQAQWTFLVYLNGDNNLEEMALVDFLEMSAVGSNDSIDIVVQFDRLSGDGYGGWTDTRRFYVTQGMEPLRSYGMSIGEANMGDPETLIDFIEWGKINYPAERYAVVIWNHGDGWRPQAQEQQSIKSVSTDVTSGGDALEMPELRFAMKSVTNGGDNPLDLLGFDACLMAMIEVDAQLFPYTDVRVGSQGLEPANGWPYTPILVTLQGTPTLSAEQLGRTIVEEYFASYDNSETQSAVDLGHFNTLTTAVDDFSLILINRVGSYYTEIDRARLSTQEFGAWDYIDLYDFAYQINQYVTDDGLNIAAANVMTAINDIIIHERSGSNCPGAHGISIYFPRLQRRYDKAYDGSYNWLQFTANTHWDEWLHAFYNNTCRDPHEPNEHIEQATYIGYGTTLMTNTDICPIGDVDYYSFIGFTGDTIIADIDARDTGSYLDSQLYLYDSDGITLTYNDDDDDSFDSYIEYTLPSDGVYYLMARDYRHNRVGGPNYFYTLSFTSDGEIVGSLAYDGYIINDDVERMDGDNSTINCGEKVGLSIALYNSGTYPISNIEAAINTADAYVNFTTNTHSTYPDIPGGARSFNNNDFEIEIDADTSDGHIIHFNLEITAFNGIRWLDSFSIPVTCPPTITAYTNITSPEDGSAHNTLPPFEGVAWATDDKEIHRVEAQIERGGDKKYWDETGWITQSTWLSATGGDVWSYTLPSTLPDDNYRLRARAWTTDDVSDTSIAEVSFIYDTISPTAVTLITPTGDLVIPAPVSVTLAWKPVTDSGSALVYWVALDDDIYTTTQSIYTVSHMTGGKHAWGVQVFDAAGNYSTWVTDTFYYPSLETRIDSPPDGSAHRMPPPFEGSVDLDETATLERVEVQIQRGHDDGYWTGERWMSRTNPFSSTLWLTETVWLTTASDIISWSYPLTHALSSDGGYTLYARAWTTAGEVDHSPAKAHIIYDTISPTATTLITPTGGVTITGGTVRLVWEPVEQDEQGSALAYIVKLDGQTYTSTQSTYTITQASSGVHTWGVQVFDAAGNRSRWVTDTFSITRYNIWLPLITRDYETTRSAPILLKRNRIVLLDK